MRQVLPMHLWHPNFDFVDVTSTGADVTSVESAAVPGFDIDSLPSFVSKEVEYNHPLDLKQDYGLTTHLTNLKPWTVYLVRASMHTVKGEGNISEAMYLRTGQTSK